MIHQLDARRLLCPLPVIKVKVQERVKTLKLSDILEIAGTNKGSLSDITAWCASMAIMFYPVTHTAERFSWHYK